MRFWNLNSIYVFNIFMYALYMLYICPYFNFLDHHHSIHPVIYYESFRRFIFSKKKITFLFYFHFEWGMSSLLNATAVLLVFKRLDFASNMKFVISCLLQFLNCWKFTDESATENAHFSTFLLSLITKLSIYLLWKSFKKSNWSHKLTVSTLVLELLHAICLLALRHFKRALQTSHCICFS